ncbi:hypothetical protein ACA910_003126 [Epithemia clementina (nom. ined.)]
MNHNESSNNDGDGNHNEDSNNNGDGKDNVINAGTLQADGDSRNTTANNSGQAAPASAADTRRSSHVSLVHGLPNKAGTACHISSPIVVLFYAVPPIRQILLQVETSVAILETRASKTKTTRTKTSKFRQKSCRLLRELSSVFQQLSLLDDVNNNDHMIIKAEIDPNPLYQALVDELGIQANDLGDAVTALSKIIHKLSSDTGCGHDDANASNYGENHHSVDRDCTVILNVVSKVIQAALGKGIVRTHLRATCSTRQRVKKNKKSRPIPNPLTLPCIFSGRTTNESDDKTLQGCLQRYTSAVVLEGYQWVAGTFEELELSDKEGHSEDFSHRRLEDQQRPTQEEKTLSTQEQFSWVTTREHRIEETPCWWFLHLDRGDHNNLGNGTRQLHAQSIDIPWLFDFSSNSIGDSGATATTHKFHLTGAILHASPEESSTDQQQQEDEEEEEPYGHYVALIPRPDQNQQFGEREVNLPPNQWFLIDDDIVTSIGYSEAMTLLAGGPAATVSLVPKHKKRTYVGKDASANAEVARTCAVLLVYQREDALDMIHPTIAQACRDLQEHVSKFSASTPTAEIATVADEVLHLVGRRLRVKWAKGKFYAGTVTDYNATTGKHTVHYDDGDMRQYNLSLKTIEWED